MYNKGLTAATVSVYLSAVRSLHVMAGLPEPVIRTPQVKLAVRAIASIGPPPKKKAPITYDLLCKMINMLTTFPEGEMWSAVLSLAFFGGLRGSEYMGQNGSTAPVVGQVQIGYDNIMHFTVTRSKTTTHGYTIPLGCSKKRVCALCLMVEYLNVRKKVRSYRVSDWLFVYSNGNRVTKEHLNVLLRSLAKKLGLNAQDYSTHSIRAGAATTAALSGFSDWEIQRIGGWKSETYRQYIRNLDGHVVKFAARLAGGLAD